MTLEQIVGTYTGRWSIETTFQECRAHLGLEDPRCRVRASVARMTPCLFGLYSVVALVYAEHIRLTGMGAGMGVKRSVTTARPWHAKPEPTFIDALEQVRWLLRDRLFATPSWNHVLQNLPPALREHILEFRPRVA